VGPQSLVWAKSPSAAIPLKVSSPGPLLVTVTIWAAPLVPTSRLPKARLRGASDTNGAITPGVW
jgi:hypothetical protein